MIVFRHFIAQRHYAALICVATLLLKLIVPGGYMIHSDRGRMEIIVCSGTATSMMTMAMPGMYGILPDHGPSQDHGKAEMPCAFAGLSAAMTGAIDPVQVVALIAFVMATGRIVTIPPSPLDVTRLRPPLRGPPAAL